MDNVVNPSHYLIYEIQPIEITRHLGFCIGNATKYALRAPYKGGAEDCLKAKQYLIWEGQTPMLPLNTLHARMAATKLQSLIESLDGDQLWLDIAEWQSKYLHVLREYLTDDLRDFFWDIDNRLRALDCCVDELRRVLMLRDTTGQMYEGMTGLPITGDANANS